MVECRIKTAMFAKYRNTVSTMKQRTQHVIPVSMLQTYIDSCTSENITV